jgi:hypothetical protein
MHVLVWQFSHVGGAGVAASGHQREREFGHLRRCMLDFRIWSEAAASRLSGVFSIFQNISWACSHNPRANDVQRQNTCMRAGI